jgi:hypothetical protein
VTAVIEAKADTDNPFSRRPTAPTFHIFAGKPAPSSSSSSSSSEQPSTAPADKTPVSAEKAAPTTPATKANEESSVEPTTLLQLHDTLDLDIEVNLDDLTSAAKVCPTPVCSCVFGTRD